MAPQLKCNAAFIIDMLGASAGLNALPLAFRLAFVVMFSFLVRSVNESHLMGIDEATKHIWAAGYKPVLTAGVLRSYFYLVNRNNGLVLQSCWIPFRDGGVGNATLSTMRDTTLSRDRRSTC